MKPRIIEGRVSIEHRWDMHTPYIDDNDMYWVLAHLEGKTIRVTIEEIHTSGEKANE